jgi:hypothetical protein
MFFCFTNSLTSYLGHNSSRVLIISNIACASILACLTVLVLTPALCPNYGQLELSARSFAASAASRQHLCHSTRQLCADLRTVAFGHGKLSTVQSAALAVGRSCRRGKATTAATVSEAAAVSARGSGYATAQAVGVSPLAAGLSDSARRQVCTSSASFFKDRGSVSHVVATGFHIASPTQPQSLLSILQCTSYHESIFNRASA